MRPAWSMARPDRRRSRLIHLDEQLPPPPSVPHWTTQKASLLPGPIAYADSDLRDRRDTGPSQASDRHIAAGKPLSSNRFSDYRAYPLGRTGSVMACLFRNHS
jgi:hypothetical protein